MVLKKTFEDGSDIKFGPQNITLEGEIFHGLSDGKTLKGNVELISNYTGTSVNKVLDLSHLGGITEEGEMLG